jgi:anthranilate phosphoribosyltransferase
MPGWKTNNKKLLGWRILKMSIKDGIKKLVNNTNLSFQESQEIMRKIMTGKTTSSQISAFLIGLRMKGETIDELKAFTEIMKENCHQIHPQINGRLVDTCGTGGDKIKTFNISTVAAFVIAGAGITIAKHGNRSVTSKSGSADVLEYLGLNLKMSPQVVKTTIEQVGIGFMFAPVFHPAMKYAVAPRKEIGVRTAFNLLGPLTNPASADAQVVGVYDPKLTEKIANVLNQLGCKEAMVVHGLDGLDEISTIGKTKISWLKETKVKTLEIKPSDFKLNRTNAENLKATNPDDSAKVIFNILYGNYNLDNPKTEIVLINSAAGIIVGGQADDFVSGIEIARKSILSGFAYKKLKELIKKSDGDLSKIEDLEAKYG